MRAFYRLPLPLPETGLPAGVALGETASFVWVLAETDPAAELEALGGVRLGARLSELESPDQGMCADPDTGLPRTVFAGDDPEAYR